MHSGEGGPTATKEGHTMRARILAKRKGHERNTQRWERSLCLMQVVTLNCSLQPVVDLARAQVRRAEHAEEEPKLHLREAGG